MKILTLSTLLALASTTLFAQADSANVIASKPLARVVDTTSMAKVYVIRSTGHVGSAVNLRVVVDDVLMCKVKNNRYAVMFVEPGTHTFNASSWDKASSQEKVALKMPVEAGKTYYMSMRIRQKFISSDIFMEEVTYNTAAPLLEKYKRDECD